MIDPLIWSTFLGGNSQDACFSFSIDQSNNLYLTGQTESANYPTITGSYQTNYQGNVDAFVSKLNSTGSSLLFSTFIGGSNAENGMGIKVDQNGNSFTTGWTESSNFPTSVLAFQSSFDSAGSVDAFVIKLNNTGSSIVYSTFLGGSWGGYASHLTIDSSGFAYIVGSCLINFPTTSGAFQTSSHGQTDPFICKMNQNGTGLIYSTYLGGSQSDECRNIKVDSIGNAYIVGYTNSNDFPITSGSYQTTKSGGQDCFVSKLNSQGTSLIFSTFLGGSGKDDCWDITLVGNTGVVVTGQTASINFPTTSGSFKTTHNSGMYDGFICQFNNIGSLLIYSTFIGGSGENSPKGIVTDISGNKIILSQTTSSNYPTTHCAYQATSGGGQDAVISKLSSDLSTLMYSTYIGGSNSEHIMSDIALDTGNNVYIAGRTFSSDFPTTACAFMPSFAGGPFDAFALKLDMTNSLTTNAISGSPFCAGDSVSVSFTTPCLLNTGNIFTALLSDTIGSFSSPVSIGTLSSTTSGTINCKFPENTFYGAGYRIRVVASNPSVSGTINCNNLIINPLQKVAFFVNDSTQCLNGNIFKFTNSSVISRGSISYVWKFGDNTTDTIINPIHTYLKSDSFIVQLHTISDKGCKDSLSDTMLTYPTPKADFVVNDSTQCLSRNSFMFSNNSIGATTYYWDFGDNSIDTASSPVHTYKSTGVFIIKLKAFNKESCYDSLVKIILVLPQPIPAFLVNDSSQCQQGNSFVFINNSSINSGSISSNWLFGDGNGSVINNPIHSYSVEGTYLVTLLMVSDSGCKDSVTRNLYIYPTPKSKFVIYDSSQCLERNNFGFINKSSVSFGSLSYLWNFGDGDTSKLTNPSHSYLIADTFPVLLVAISDKNCIDSFIGHTYLHVHPKPLANFSVNDSTQCLSGNIFFLLNSSTIKSGSFAQKWDFADGFDTNSYNSTHSYSIADSYMVKLLIISDWICKDSVLKQVIVHHEQTTDFNVTDTIVCIGEAVYFNNTSTYNYGTLSFNWDFADGNNSVITNPQHSFSTDGTYIVKLKSISNFGCKDSVLHKIYVYPNPKTDFTINDTTQCLQGNSFNFTDNSSIKTGSLAQFYFDLGDGANSSLSSITHGYASVGSYLVKLVIKSDQGCPDSLSKQIYVNPMPKASFSININPQNLIGNNFIFTSTSTIPTGNLNYSWDFGDGDTSSKINPSHSYTKIGRYAVKMIVKSDYGCADTFIDTAIIRFPNINISITLPDGCIGIPVYFKNKSTVNPPDSFLNFIWDYGDGNQAIIYDDPQHIYYSAGKYIITFVCLTAFGNKDTLVDTIEIYPSPTIDITAVPDSILIPGSSVTLNANGVFDQLLWNDNSTGTSIIVQKSGKYWVTASFTTGCKSSDTIWLIDGEKKEMEIVTVFTPNGDGYNDYFVIKDFKNYQPVKLAIYNRWGDELFSSSDYQNKWDGTYKGKHLPEGTYYYVLETKDGKVYKGAVNILR